ncbi:hypothetical protein Tco_1274484, partial [Tanacetum coccineum]
MGELTFFLGLQVKQKEDGIFISQDTYVAKILKKFNYTDVKSAFTPVDLEKPLIKDGDAADVDVHLYRSMIGYLMYLTASRPDIMFVVCTCARFQVTPKTSHLLAIKRIFRYLKGKPTLGLWYSRDSPFEIVAYTDSDYARATQDRKSTTEDLLTKGFDAGRFQYLVSSEKVNTASTSINAAMLPLVLLEGISVFLITVEIFKALTLFIGNLVSLCMKIINSVVENLIWMNINIKILDLGEVEIKATVDGHDKTITEASVRSSLQLEDADGISNMSTTEIFEQLALMG